MQASLQTVHPRAGATSQVASTDASVPVTSSGGGLGNGAIKDYHITFGTAVNAVSAVDIPIADAGGYYAGTTIETALQEIGAGTLAGYVQTSGSATGATAVQQAFTNGIKAGGAANYTAIDAGGHLTMGGTATVYDDLRVAASAVRRPSANPPGLETWKGNVQLLAFDKTTAENVDFELQFPHSRKSGSNVYPHVHWMPKTAGTGAVQWGLEYSWAELGGTLATPGTVFGTTPYPHPPGGQRWRTCTT